MSEYTAEDFAQANLATKGKYDAARRAAPNLAHQWQVYGSRQEWLSDQEMVHAGWVPVVEAPLSLKDLEVAWESAEVPTIDTPIREGDVVIARNETDFWGYYVRRAHPIDFKLGVKGYVRVLSRAPKREPWEELAEALADRSTLMGDIETAAKALHEAGWRKTGGDEL